MKWFVVADYRRCVGCFACQAACIENHRKAGLQAYPRLIVTHTPSGAMPVQCRHCETPSCAAVCPVRAIIVEDQTVRLNESLCIGCKMCALACPFGAILPGGTPVPNCEFNVGQYLYTNHPYQPAPMYLREIAVEDSISLLGWSIGQKTVAVKCDLCYFSEDGPACVIACPHKALRLVDDETAGPDSFAAQIKALAVVER
ncbi:MAG: 4Fe-4S dicluster domain-containing protein [Chloroflexota bacterium]